MWPPPPPPDETELERAMRIQEESIATDKSREIDLQIETDKQAQKNRTPIRILLLGQPPSIFHLPREYSRGGHVQATLLMWIY